MPSNPLFHSHFLTISSWSSFSWKYISIYITCFSNVFFFSDSMLFPQKFLNVSIYLWVSLNKTILVCVCWFSLIFIISTLVEFFPVDSVVGPLAALKKSGDGQPLERASEWKNEKKRRKKKDSEISKLMLRLPAHSSTKYPSRWQLCDRVHISIILTCCKCTGHALRVFNKCSSNCLIWFEFLRQMSFWHVEYYY